MLPQRKLLLCFVMKLNPEHLFVGVPYTRYRDQSVNILPWFGKVFLTVGNVFVGAPLPFWHAELDTTLFLGPLDSLDSVKTELLFHDVFQLHALSYLAFFESLRRSPVDAFTPFTGKVFRHDALLLTS